MKKLVSSLALASALALSPVPAQADNNDELCGFYGNLGAATIDYMMPLTMQQVVNMIAGKDQALMNAMTTRIEGVMTDRVADILKAEGDDAAELLSESAGFQSFQIVMSGQATSGGEVFMILSNACQRAGAKSIIDNQRRLRSANGGGR